MITSVYKNTVSILSFFIFIVLVNLHGFAQCPANTVSTDWNKYGTGGNITNFPNSWNWAQAYYSDFYILGASNFPTTIPSPWLDNNGGGCDNPNFCDFWLDANRPNLADKDIWPKDGWELLTLDKGLPSGIPNQPDLNAISNPSFSLYNKYRSFIRVFFYITDRGNFQTNKAFISMSNTSTTRQSSLLEPTHPVLSPVKIFTKNVFAKSPVSLIDASRVNYWVYADFPVIYDPCMCNYQTFIKFQLDNMAQADLEFKLAGDLIGTINSTQPIVSTSSNSVNTDNFLTTVNAGAKLAESGAKSYKQLNSFTSTFNKFVNDHQNQSINSIISDLPIITTAFTGFTGTLPLLTTAWGLFSNLVTGGKDSPSDNTKAPPPMSWEADLKIDASATGSITTSGFIASSTTYFAPGVISNSNNTYAKTIWNNTLGVFNIIDVPKIEYLTYFLPGWALDAEQNSYLCTRNVYDPITMQYNTVSEVLPYPPQVREYHIKDPIKYVINPASGLAVHKIRASIQFRPRTKNFLQTINLGNGTIVSRGPNISYQEKDRGPFISIRALPLSYSNYENELQQEKVSVASWPKKSTNQDFINNTIFKTDFVPLQCITKSSFRYYFVPEVDENPEIFLKLVITLKRIDNPNAQDVEMWLTYKVDDNYIYAGRKNLQLDPEGCNNVVTYIDPSPWNPNYGSYPQNIVLDGNTYPLGLPQGTYIAKEKITITNNLIFLPNVNYTIIAGNEIETSNNSLLELNPNINLMIGQENLLGCSVPVETLQEIDIDTYCNPGGEYDNFSSSFQGMGERAPSFLSPDNVNIFPNPASDNLNIVIDDIDFIGVAEVQISDVQGRVEFISKVSNLSNKSKPLKVDISSLSTGVYFCEISFGVKKAVKKLVVVNKD